MQPCCKNCVHSRGDTSKATKKMSCRRFPPQLVWPPHRKMPDAFFPITYENDVCGEFSPREERD